MNGIIHQCSHPNDVDAHFRRSEDKIFIDIFNYIDHIFTKIKPMKVFFMAVDGIYLLLCSYRLKMSCKRRLTADVLLGVAPRAKMNQQRSRRFRTAKEAADAIRRAQDKEQELPEEEPFDSNCITPGSLIVVSYSALRTFDADALLHNTDNSKLMCTFQEPCS
jgi:5'-3' exoribonuclease 1